MYIQCSKLFRMRKTDTICIRDVAEACKDAALLIFVLPHIIVSRLLPNIQQASNPFCRGFSLRASVISAICHRPFRCRTLPPLLLFLCSRFNTNNPTARRHLQKWFRVWAQRCTRDRLCFVSILEPYGSTFVSVDLCE